MFKLFFNGCYKALAAELPVTSQISGTQSYVIPKIPSELIGVTELAFKGPSIAPKLYLTGRGPKEGHIVRRTILFHHRQPQEILDDQTIIQVLPLPADSPELPKYKVLIDMVQRQNAESNKQVGSPEEP